MFKNLKFKDYIIALLVILVFGLLISLRISQNNNKSSDIIFVDSLRYYQNKLGEEYKAKDILILDKETLEKNFSDLNEEYKKLKDNPIIIIKTVTNVKIDSIKLNDTIILTPNSNIIKWDFAQEFSKNNNFSVNGYCEFDSLLTKSNSYLTSLKLSSELYLDIIEKNKKLEIIAKSNNPYLNISNIEGVIISPEKSKVLNKYFKPKRFGLGICAGYGIGVYNSKVYMSPQITLGITYNFFSF